MSLKGIPKTEEHKKKISESRIGEKHWFFGKKFSKETIKKKSDSAKKSGVGKWMKGRKLSLETRKKMSESRKGSKGNNWKGGITPINNTIRNSLEYRLWRETVFKRDNYTCVWCGIKSMKGVKVILQADHIKPFAYYPELRFAIDNGRTLCRECHLTTNTYGERAKNCWKEIY